MPNHSDIEIVSYAPKRARKARKIAKRIPPTTTPKKKRTKAKLLSKYKKEFDAIFSKFIRERDTHTCYTCGLVMEPKKSQNGHFVPRQYLATRWDEVNCHAQCYACNVLYNGQPSAYAKRLKEDFGPDIVEVLESKRKTLVKLDKDYYEYWIPIYTEKLAEMLLTHATVSE